jgi:2-polyprenyl-3-methyl-5-hydroxy-6-metoxy-1,4-benzoquinol methylase
VDFTGKRVLEVGAGEGRLTWRYAGPTAFVLGIDPDAESVEVAKEETPPELAGRVEFRVLEAEELAEPETGFDIAFLSWSL